LLTRSPGRKSGDTGSLGDPGTEWHVGRHSNPESPGSRRGLFYRLGKIREGLAGPREPALLTSAGRMPKRSQHRASEGQDVRSERPATGHGQPRTACRRSPRLPPGGNPGSRRKSGGKFFSTDSLHPLKRFGRMRRGAGRSSRMLHAGLSGADRRTNADASDIVPIAASIFL
jgi:hypothetical protein